MTTQLPHNLQVLFAPRPTLRWVAPIDVPPEQRRTPAIEGTATFVDALREYKGNDNANWKDFEHSDQEVNETVNRHFKVGWTDSRHQNRVNNRLIKQEKQRKLLTEDAPNFDPAKDPKVAGDPIKTLFVGRLSYSSTDRDLEKEFSRFGPIKRIRLVKEERPKAASESSDGLIRSKKPHRGYAFIEFERERDSQVAYQNLNGARILDKHVVVDVERGRTVEGWRPRRLGGGKGGRHYTKAGMARPSQFGGYYSGSYGAGGMRGSGGYGGRGGSSRGGLPDGPRGGGFRGRGGFGGFDRGGFGGPRGASGGFAPEGAPAGPRGRGGYGGPAPGRPYERHAPSINGYDDRNGYGGGHGGGGYGGGRYDNRGVSGSNAEPVAARASRYDRDNKMEDDYSRKRPYDQNHYDDHRSKRRY